VVYAQQHQSKETLVESVLLQDRDKLTLDLVVVVEPEVRDTIFKFPDIFVIQKVLEGKVFNLQSLEP
jgi:hypothetical protein